MIRYSIRCSCAGALPVPYIHVGAPGRPGSAALLQITKFSDGTNAYRIHIPGPTHEMILADHSVDKKNIEMR